jgi:hypothetical protein
MMQVDLWRLAAMLLQRYGDSAETYACIRADEAKKQNNERARDTWKSIAKAVCELEQQGPVNNRLH